MSEELPGSSLKEAREAKGLSMSDVASSTHIKVQIIEDLEENDFSRIAAPIYGKGFIKLYAEFLGLEPQPLLDAYLKRMASGGIAPRRSRKPRPASTPPQSSPGPATAPTKDEVSDDQDAAGVSVDPGPKELPLDFNDGSTDEVGDSDVPQKSDPQDFASQVADVISPAVPDEEPDLSFLDEFDSIAPLEPEESALVEDAEGVPEESEPKEEAPSEKAEEAPVEEPEVEKPAEVEEQQEEVPAPPPKTPSELAAEHKRNYITVVVSVIIIIGVVIVGINSVVKERQAQADKEANRPDAPLNVSEEPPEPYLD